MVIHDRTGKRLHNHLCIFPGKSHSALIDCQYLIFHPYSHLSASADNPIPSLKAAPETIREDIRKEQAYVIVEKNRIYGVFIFFTGIEPTYRLIESGVWLNDAPYGTVHRTAGNEQCKGILAEILSFCEKQINNIRIDTHDDNKIMQHLLTKYGYQKCGYIYVEDGSRRIAYQKVVRTSSAEETYP